MPRSPGPAPQDAGHTRPGGRKGAGATNAMSSGFPATAGLNNSVMVSLLGIPELGESTPAAVRLLRGPLPAAFFC